MKHSTRSRALAVTFSLLSVVWVSSSVGLLQASASMQDRIRERMEQRRSAVHEAAPAQNQNIGKSPLEVSIRGPEALPLNGTATFRVRVANHLPFVLVNAVVEQRFEAIGADGANSFLTLIPERSDRRCSASASSAGSVSCALGNVSPAGSTSLTLTYRVERCVPGFRSFVLSHIAKTSSWRTRDIGGTVTGCSPSDRTL